MGERQVSKNFSLSFCCYSLSRPKAGSVAFSTLFDKGGLGIISDAAFRM